MENDTNNQMPVNPPGATEASAISSQVSTERPETTTAALRQAQARARAVMASAEASAASSHAEIEPTSPKTRLGWVPALAEVELSDDAKALLGEYLGKGYCGEITGALLREAVKIRDLLDKVDSRNLMARYEVGQAIREVWEEKRAYGSNPVVKLAKLIGRSSSLLHDLMNIARTWPDAEEFAAIVARTSPDGARLTWNHFVELSREADTDRRQRLTDLALWHGWSAEYLTTQRRARRVIEELGFIPDPDRILAYRRDTRQDAAGTDE